MPDYPLVSVQPPPAPPSNTGFSSKPLPLVSDIELIPELDASSGLVPGVNGAMSGLGSDRFFEPNPNSGPVVPDDQLLLPLAEFKSLLESIADETLAPYGNKTLARRDDAGVVINLSRRATNQLVVMKATFVHNGLRFECEVCVPTNSWVGAEPRKSPQSVRDCFMYAIQNPDLQSIVGRDRYIM